MASVNVTLEPETHRYFVNGVTFEGPSVTQALCQCGLADFSFLDEEIRERSMKRGTSVHWMCALHDQGALNYRNLPHWLRPYRSAWMAFRKNTGFVPDTEWIERSFVSPMGYCGTIDRKGHFGNFQYYLLDIKSENIPAHARVQTALYAKAIHVVNRMAVALKSDGTYSTKPYPVSELGIDYATGVEAVRRWRPDANY